MSMSMNEYEKWSVRAKQEQEMNEQQKQRAVSVADLAKESVPCQPVMYEFNYLMAALDSLTDHMQKLENKMSVILADLPPPPEETMRSREGHSQFCGMLFHANLKVEALNKHVCALIDRLEI